MSNAIDQNKLYYSVNEVRDCVYSGCVSRSTLLKMVHKDIIPSVRIMSRIYIPRWWVIEQINLALGEQNNEESTHN